MHDFQKTGAFLCNEPGQALVVRGPFHAAADPPARGVALYVPDFFLEDPAPWRIPADCSEISLEDLASRIPVSGSGPISLDWTEPRFEDFSETYEDLKTRIAAGTLSKAVPVAFSTSHVENPRSSLLPRLIKNAALAASPLLPFGFWDETGGVVGATPEVLFRANENGRVHSMALAGTTSPAGAARLLETPKECHEHRIVLEDILAALSPMGPICCGKTEVMALPGLAHMKTEITLEADPAVPFLQLVRALHPTPALGGSPREASLAWIKARDRGIARGCFGAPFGITTGRGAGLCVVAIRCLQWTGNTVRLGAGAGVVAASEVEREWEELTRKRDAVKRMLLS